MLNKIVKCNNFEISNNNKISLDLMSFKSLDLLVLPLPNNRNNWWVHLFKNNKINIIGNLSSLSFKNSKGMILGSQEVEYTDYNKLIKPEELKNTLSKENFHFNNIKGLVFDPINREWKLSKNYMINYFCTANLIN